MLLYSISIHLYIIYSIINMSSNLFKRGKKNKIQSIFLHNILKNIQCILGCSEFLYIEYSNRLNNMQIESLNNLLSKLPLYLRYLSNIYIRSPQKNIPHIIQHFLLPLLLPILLNNLYNNHFRNLV